ncbi:hypothetical protein O6H91_14G057900 [Diphasiastrum complanatum]|uniref:Uncharacterized protein n=2 Tax=Diphasiastrum complanatum TaxID=34168 RepID=A0ACC2BQ01_DIPCM|nr:hypothetical protein O6H91_14G057900 [Diphasiastrum complanatum]KAJ7531773.1 hypothetical protein O6H91_14G057900 [Diphasiastrum complanatum]
MATSSGGNFKTSLFNGQDFVGEVTVSPQTEQNNLKLKFGKEIRLTSFSPLSDRCSPLLVLHTISSDGPLFGISSSPQSENNQLTYLWTTCFTEAKTAMLLMDDGAELHLVAMNSKSRSPCFWAFRVVEGLYASCLSMLNLRCLAMVFDLDETLIVANTMRSFEDRVEILERKLRSEADPQRQLVISAELKRYQEDRTILKQYVESDQIFESGRLLKAQQEVVPPSADGLLPILRPIIRIPERNIVLTRINPSVRDTSVLVRLRPAWEELRNYVLAKGRKRFEVFICTMSEKDYALEMWRLLDPEGRLIGTREIQERLLCVKSGSKKSLLNVFARGRCLRKLAMIIDDRLKVWEDQDQTHVHVVPAFAPYYAPQAETSLPLPILCIARNVACSVRNSFFKEFDENLSQELGEAHFDTDWSLLPQAPDASNFLLSEDDMMPFVVGNGVSKEFPDGMTDSEVEARIKPQVESGNEHLLVQPDKQFQALSTAAPSFQLQSSSESEGDKSFTFSGVQVAVPFVAPQLSWQQPSFQNSPAREEGEVPESELDPDTRRRLLILQHGQDTGPVRVAEKVEDSIHRSKPSLQIRIPTGPSPGGWLGEEELSPDQASRASPGILLEPESPSFETQRMHPSTFGLIGSSNDQGLGNIRQHLPEMLMGELRPRVALNPLDCSAPSDEDEDLLKTIAKSKLWIEKRHIDPVQSLKEIAQISNALVEYKSQLNKTTDLQFAVEVSFNGAKIGEGIGRTNREARIRAAEKAIEYLASDPRGQIRHLLSRIGSRHLASPYFGEDDRLPHWSAREHYNFAGTGPMLIEEEMSSTRTAGKTICRPAGEDLNPSSSNAVTTLKDLCTFEGLAVFFSKVSIQRTERSKIYTSQVEVAGKVLGKGSGFSWEISEQEAAKEALRILKPSHPVVPLKRMNTPRSPPLQGSKRVRAGELLRSVSSIPASPGQSRSRVSPKRYTKVGTPIS